VSLYLLLYLLSNPTDWDGAGHLHLVVARFAGTFDGFKEERSGRFRPKPELIMAGDAPLRVTSPCQRRLKKDRRNHAGRQLY
jgi:hypothetical protein